VSDLFKKYYPTQASNINGCSQLGDAKKREFADHMAKLPADATKDDVRRHAEGEFFFNTENQFLGKGSSPRKGQRVGRLHLWTAMEAAASAIPRDMFARAKTEYLGGDTSVVNELADQLEDVPLRNPIVWGFVFSSSSQPKASDLPDLPCSLGLENLDVEAYLRLELKISPGLRPKTPTAFDAGLNRFWRPGGVTWPRDPCREKNGFPEVVMPSRSIDPKGLTFGDIGPLETR
jgi:hypothetical protein